MKRYLFLCLLTLFIRVDAQNEKTESQKFFNEIKTQRKPKHYRDIQQSRNYYNMNNLSEVWLRILEDGRFRVEIGGQVIENSTGYYRFFDLNRGRKMLSIYENNYLIYRTPIELKRNTRLMLDFDGYALYLYDEIDLNSYNYDVFPDIMDNRYMRELGHKEFEDFFRSYRSKSFDSDKINVFYIKAKNTYFTAQQIGRLVKTLSFDSKKLELAKAAYDYCIDPENYYQVVDVLDYQSSKTELKDYILQKR